MRASIKAITILTTLLRCRYRSKFLSRPGWLSLSNMISFSLNVLCLKKEHLWQLCTHQLCFLQHQSSCLHRIITQVRLKFTKLYINYLIYISSRKYSVLHHEWVVTKDPLVKMEKISCLIVISMQAIIFAIVSYTVRESSCWKDYTEKS